MSWRRVVKKFKEKQYRSSKENTHTACFVSPKQYLVDT